mmetsp:Transcript_1850/g.5578  ORF Transcript_1850/g.5578 Transcript_1850/m.5578 type:complete len:235 (+) Transcript_1850:454-1158(+)
MLLTAGGLALVQSAYPQRLRQFMLFLLEPAKEESDLAHKYLHGTWVVLGNALWGLASVVWLFGAVALVVSDVILASVSASLDGACMLGLGTLTFASLPLPCAALHALALLLAYALLAAFLISGWYTSLEDSLRMNDGQGSSRCWESCCVAESCRSSLSCQNMWSVDMKAWAIVFQATVMALQALATLALPFNLASSTAWFLFVAAHLFGAGVFLMVDAQEKIASQMSYEARTVD